MNEFIMIGKIVNTHGIKGEIKLLSNFSRKELVFKPSTKIYIGYDKCLETIKTYRYHKIFDMITLDGIDNINDVLKYKGAYVFVKRNSLELKPNEYLNEDLINFFIIENEKVLGKIKNIVYNKANILLYIEGEKNFYIPLNPFYIKNVDIKNKKVIVKKASDLIL